jgi:RpiR family carbohydrate utilization transcriptional regulator
VNWTGNDDATVTTRISTVRNSLQPSELSVVAWIVDDAEGVVEMTAQDLSDRAGVARSSVIRTCQKLGYRGFAQLRVALTRELAQTLVSERDYGASALGAIRADIDTLAATLPRIASVLNEDAVEQAVSTIVAAGRLLALASGLSSPLALDLGMRLTAIGRPTEFVADPIGQQIAARQLSPADAVLIISGSGASEASLKAARAARQTGAAVVVITSFATSPLVSLADISLVVAPAGGTFRQELEHTSRVPHVILIESLVDVVAARLGEHARATRSAVLEILSDNLSE